MYAWHLAALARAGARMGFRVGYGLVSSLLFTALVNVSWIQADEGSITPDERAASSIRHPAGLEVQLWADSTQVSNPVAFAFDERGRMYVCETFRQEKGVEDNRSHMSWLDDDLAAQTVEDRLAYFRKHLGDEVSKYGEQEDRIVRISDEDGDGRADSSHVFADGFRDILDGTGAGVLVHGDEVYYTCIPHLWRLRDPDQDGRADVRDSLHRGYGVRVAFRGHDLHGLTLGPDGRLYFSIGDRGYHVVTAEGITLHDPESGAVFRCELDGSRLEVFATGLRNPQELVFDDHGNLFTGDNNSDGGDQARWMHLIEGSDTGWRMSFQYLPDRGPWNREKLWHPYHSDQPAFIVPPVTNFGDGPSGISYYPGTGLGDAYRGTFFMCDFRGDAAMSGVRSFKLQRRGATFDLTEPDKFLWNVLATDLDFGPDGGLYLTDWIEGWEGVGRGRIVRVTNPAAKEDPQVRDMSAWMAKDLSQVDGATLTTLLDHNDRRIRARGQGEFVRRNDLSGLFAAAKSSEDRVRLHATWGIAHIGRLSEASRRSECCHVLARLLDDRAAEVRAVAATSLGELQGTEQADDVSRLLEDRDPRVRMEAAIAVGKLRHQASLDRILEILAKNTPLDPALRHAASLGLAGVADVGEIALLAEHPNELVRMGAVLALRRGKHAELQRFLHDPAPAIVVEAARAIHDVPIKDAYSALAKLIPGPIADDSLIRRVLNANYRLGAPEHASALGAMVRQSSLPASLRMEALDMLAQWRNPGPRDRVLGMWRPLAERSDDPARLAIRQLLPEWKDLPPDLAAKTAQIASTFRMEEGASILEAMIHDDRFSPVDRASLLVAIAKLEHAKIGPLLDQSLSDEAAEVRSAARSALAERDPSRALTSLRQGIASSELSERQAAWRTLREYDVPGTDTLSEHSLQQLERGEFPTDTMLDLVETIRRRGSDKSKEQFDRYLKKLAAEPLGLHRLALAGGDASQGERLFNERLELSCLRCHKVGKEGGRVGPNLAGMGKTKTPEYILESIVTPNKAIAEGFGTLVVVTVDGDVKQGIVRKETDDMIHMVDVDGNRFAVLKSEIETRQQGRSAMPDDLVQKISPFELRDLMAYLISLQTPYVEPEQHE